MVDDTILKPRERLKRHWETNGVEINSGVSEADLITFQTQHAVVLPDDLRNYFLCVNGMAPDVMDDQLIRFWMLDEVRPLNECAPEFSHPEYIQRAESIFLFADYSIWAHAYGIRLESFPSESNEVFIIGYDSPVKISDSFSNFVDHYLTNRTILH